MLNLRPQTIDEFIGKQNLKENLKTFIQAANARGTCLDHILLHGLAGTGKTTLAIIIANEFNKKLKIVQGTMLKKLSDLINFISMLCENDIIFIDEIHAMSEECMETLYSILEDFAIDITIGKENNQKITRVSLPKFTLIGATTNITKIPKPLEERFGINFFFDLYDYDEISEIIHRTSKLLNLELDANEVQVICENSKGIPRIVNHLIKRIIDFKTIDPKITIKSIFSKLEIFELGLQTIDIKYLKTLAGSDDYIGLRTIASVLELDITFIENKIEPYLLRNEFIKKTNRGRMLTNKGAQYVNNLQANC